MTSRVDVRAQPHEIGGRGGVAAHTCEHERSPATLQYAHHRIAISQIQISFAIRGPRMHLQWPRTVSWSSASIFAPSRTSSVTVAVRP
jgi:hypothetical protein